MVRRKRDVAIIVLRCVIFGCCTGAQQTAFGTGMATPPKSAAGSYVLVAQADTQAIMHETKSADAPAEPQAVMQEIRSASHLSGSKQRRRKPKMAGVPDGTRLAAKEAEEPEPRAAAKEAKGLESQAAALEVEETNMPDKPLAVAQKAKDADASSKPQAETKGLKMKNTGKKYSMAPIRWRVNISETAGLENRSQTQHLINSPSSTSQANGFVNSQTAEIQAKTYILQPYIAQLGGDIGVVSSRNNSTGGVALSSRNNRLFGNGSLSLFSQSRFPFGMSLGVNDARNSTETQTQGMVDKRLTLNQTYRPLGSRSMYGVNYSRDTQTTNLNNWSSLSNANPNDFTTHSSWRGNYSTSTLEHRIDIATTYNEKTTSLVQKISRRADNFRVSDDYLPADSLLSFNSNASLNLSNDTVLRARYLQANTKVGWQPEDEDIPLFVDGNVRLFKMSSTVKDSDPISSQSLGGDANARYLFSKNLTGNANGGVMSADLNGTRDFITFQRGILNYSSDAINLWKSSYYSWNASGGASNQTGRASDSSIFGGVGHGLSVPYTFTMFGKKLLMNSRIGQSLNPNIARVDGRSITLSNSGSISLSGLSASVRPYKELLGGYATAEGAMNTMATLSVDDRRKMGGQTPSHSRTYSLILNLQETSQAIYSRYGIEAEATLGATQGTSGTVISGTVRGTVSYRKAGVFGVRRLDYAGSLKTSAQSNSKGVFDVNARNPTLPWELDQRLQYKIGQNEVLLRGNISDQYGVKNSSLWLLFRAWRSIGN